MNSYRSLLILVTSLGLAAVSQAQVNTGFAPASLSNVIFNGVLTGATGGANPTGAVNLLFSNNGLDYSLGAMGELSSPVAFTYTKTGENTATIVEPQMGTPTPLTVTLSFMSAVAGTFAADYGSGKTQAGTFTLSSIPFEAPVTNMSNRVFIRAGEMAIPGFVIDGSAPRRVLIRAVGPGLAPFNVPNVLVNPSIQVYRGQTQIASNDDWSSDASLPALFSQVGAFNLPAGSRDAALVATLAPGAYTAFIRGGTATEQGEVLIELYFVD